MKTTLVNIRLEDASIETLDRLAGKGLNRQAVARMLLMAAIDAVEKNQGNLHFPPQFSVEQKALDSIEMSRLNEPSTRYKHIKK